MSDRQQMLRDIEMEVAFTRGLIGRSAFDGRVMAAMAEVPRHRFIPEEARDMAYVNGPVPIGHGQTISQPYIVALMTDLLAPEPGDVMLEVGTGSGYQAAILSRLVKQVYTLEIIEPLSRRAESCLRELGYGNVLCKVADGYQGWPEQGPYDGILVTAATPVIPEPLVAQLKPGARLVIPVGLPHYHQELFLVEKDEYGHASRRSILGVAFVPLTGAHARPEPE
ncbi:MAG: protein-L-isoaspartate(D-aspartate) O-methyltransferase [Gammaproteobacteria bacterium]|nr:protein-L-isoaspartate(D-aspartate) O-methyltransferase [Gammaproteobacteria bacterium]MBU1653775.1 protein-L-isoaspartate(D-aspartate) O-methyltransferase [Gammaproteobacteria bacterium]MBU1962117.1 protein-L-isoaspartate(D-aspartate) O-methyltransferase [Gammaproteobacteria bacterium]